MSNNINLEIPICKAEMDGDDVYITGVVMRPSKIFKDGKPVDYEDSHGNWATVEEVKKACRACGEKIWNNKDIKVDKQHDKKGGRGVIVENYIAKTDIPDLKAKEDDWIVTVRAGDAEIAKDIQEGKITAFSIGGTALIIPAKEVKE